MIWGVQDGLYFGGERLQREVGAEAALQLPRIATAFKLGLTVAGGTDAHRVSSYNPFVALQWYLDGTTIGGVQTRGDAEAPSRRQALEMYTRNTAFAANEDDKRGTLEPGKFADLAVLSADYLTAPVKEIGKIKSVLTMVGGNVVHAAAPFANLAPRQLITCPVMAGLVPAIHVLLQRRAKKDVDARDKPGHDASSESAQKNPPEALLPADRYCRD